MRQAFFSAQAGNSIVAVAATVCFLLIGAPKADAAGSKWYVGASIPVMYIDDTDTVTQGSNIDPSQPLAPPVPTGAKPSTNTIRASSLKVS